MKIIKNILSRILIKKKQSKESIEKEISLAQKYYEDAQKAFEKQNYKKALSLLMSAFSADPDFKPEGDVDLSTIRKFNSKIKRESA